jgi:hypothetical protein
MIRRGRRAASGAPSRAIAPTGHDGTAPHTDYADEGGDVLTLRWALPARSRLLYERVRRATPEAELADRAAEFLFSRLAVRWVIDGVAIAGRAALEDRYVAATEAQRAFVHAALRAHAAEHYPELESP